MTPYGFELGYGLLTLVYDTLLWRDRHGVPQPWLARSVDTSVDGKQVTLKLREGARWHDGAPVTADDVVFTFGLFISRPQPRFTPQLGAVERVTDPDPGTVVVKLRHPSPGFADQPLADLPILPAHLWRSLPGGVLEPLGLAVGSGPYRLVGHDPQSGYRFEANPDYFRGRPLVGAIDVPIVASAEEMVAGMERHRLDLVPLTLPAEVKERMRGIGQNVATGPSYLGMVLLFNVREPPFDRLEARQAVARAIDVQALAREVGGAIAADHGYLHPASPWSSSRVLARPGPSQRPETLGLPPLTILTSNVDPAKQQAGREVALSLSTAGFDAGIAELSPNDLSRAIGQDGAPPSFQMAITNSSALASYDPDFLARMFGSDPAAGLLNYSGYRSPTFDALAARIASTTDHDDRKLAVEQALALLAADLPSLPLLFPDRTFTYQATVYNGWTFVKGTGVLDKQSFLDGDRMDPQPTIPAAPSSRRGGPSWSIIALAILGIAASAIIIELVRRRD